MRAYIADLSAYVDGKLVGEWVYIEDFSDAEELLEYIHEEILLPDSEEWAVHDYEGGWNLGEHPGAEELVALAHAAEELPYDYSEAIVQAYVDRVGGPYVDYDNLVESILDADGGVWDSPEEWAWDFVESTGELKNCPTMEYYFDEKSFARDAELSGDIDFIKLPDRTVWAMWAR